MSVLDQLESLETEAVQKKFEAEAEKPIIIRIHDELTKKYQFRRNDISKKVEFKKVGTNEWEPILDEHLNTMWIEFQLNNDFKGKEKPTDKLLYKLINSHFTDKYNAIKDFFTNTNWDGKDHFSELTKCLEVEDFIIKEDVYFSQIWKSLFKQWLISCVACMIGRAPNHVMLVLGGGQGIGKTTFLNKLCPPDLDKDYRVTGHINPDLKDDNTANYLAEKAFINIDDQLDNIFVRDFNAIKSIITIDKINNRKKYAHFETSRPRIANIVGSVNQDRIFIDSENRRYFFIKVNNIKYQNEVNINQVWAQIYHEYKQGSQYFFDNKQTSLLNAINDHFAKLPPEQEFFNLCYEVTEVPTINSVYIQFSEIISTLKQVSGLNMREHILTVVLKKMNIKPISKRIDNMPRYVYHLNEKFIKDSYGKINIMKYETGLNTK